MKIIWTERALRCLKSIRNYHVKVAGEKVALHIVKDVFDDASLLLENPLLGKKETELSDNGMTYRSLVSSNYKIVYWIELDIIYVAILFDCRQNTQKLQQLLK